MSFGTRGFSLEDTHCNNPCPPRPNPRFTSRPGGGHTLLSQLSAHITFATIYSERTASEPDDVYALLGKTFYTAHRPPSISSFTGIGGSANIRDVVAHRNLPHPPEPTRVRLSNSPGLRFVSTTYDTNTKRGAPRDKTLHAFSRSLAKMHTSASSTTAGRKGDRPSALGLDGDAQQVPDELLIIPVVDICLLDISSVRHGFMAAPRVNDTRFLRGVPRAWLHAPVLDPLRLVLGLQY